MSDSGVITEQRLLSRHGPLLKSDVLVLGRHSDDLFATEDFLRAVDPSVIILAPSAPFEDHEGEEALRARLTATGATIFDQEECGAVIITMQENSLEIRAFLTGLSEKLKKT